MKNSQESSHFTSEPAWHDEPRQSHVVTEEDVTVDGTVVHFNYLVGKDGERQWLGNR